jgi:hypothetical protein
MVRRCEKCRISRLSGGTECAIALVDTDVTRLLQWRCSGWRGLRGKDEKFVLIEHSPAAKPSESVKNAATGSQRDGRHSDVS